MLHNRSSVACNVSFCVTVSTGVNLVHNQDSSRLRSLHEVTSQFLVRWDRDPSAAPVVPVTSRDQAVSAGPAAGLFNCCIDPWISAS